MSARQNPRTHAGMTLIELVISIVIISIALTAILSVMGFTTARSADPMLRQQANAIGQSYLEEILLRPVCDPNDFSTDCFAACTTSACSGCSGSTLVGGGSETRATYDDVCDYDGLSDNGARDQHGNSIAALGAYNIGVNVDDAATLNGLDGTGGQVVLVTVVVSHATQGNIQVSLSGYRANY